LWLACEAGHLGVVHRLLQCQEVDPNVPQLATGISPLCIASKLGFLEIVRVLLGDSRVNVNATRRDGATPFFAACEAGTRQVVALMVQDPRVDVNRVTDEGCSPLWAASSEGHIDAVTWILATDREIDMQPPRGGSGLEGYGSVAERARSRGHTHLADLLRNYAEDPTKVRHDLQGQLGIKGELLDLLSLLTFGFGTSHELLLTVMEVPRRLEEAEKVGSQRVAGEQDLERAAKRKKTSLEHDGAEGDLLEVEHGDGPTSLSILSAEPVQSRGHRTPRQMESGVINLEDDEESQDSAKQKEGRVSKRETALKGDIAKLKAQLTEALNDLRSEHKQVKDLTLKIKKLEATFWDLEKKKKELETTSKAVTRLREEVHGANSQVSKLQQELNTEKAASSQLRLLCTAESSSNADLRVKLFELGGGLDEARKTIAAMQARLAAVFQQMRAEAEKKGQFEAEVTRLKTCGENNQRDMRSKIAEIKNLEATLKARERETHNMASLVTVLNQKLEESTKGEKKAGNEARAAHVELQQTKEMVATFQSTVQTLQELESEVTFLRSNSMVAEWKSGFIKEEVRAEEMAVPPTPGLPVSLFETATDHFAGQWKVREGLFGEVFKGRLFRLPVHVTRVQQEATAVRRAFMLEFPSFAKLRHPLLAEIFASSDLGLPFPCFAEQLLPQGTLRDRLDLVEGTPPLPLSKKLSIMHQACRALEAARELLEMDNRFRAIVLRSRDILLDEGLQVKVSVTGLLEGHVAANHLECREYLSPEFQRDGRAGAKVTVYSLGVILAEILTALPPAFQAHSVPMFLHATFLQMVPSALSTLGAVHLDPKLVGNGQSLTAVTTLARECLDPDPVRRPHLAQVTLRLLEALEERRAVCLGCQCGLGSEHSPSQCGHDGLCKLCSSFFVEKGFGCPVCGAPLVTAPPGQGPAYSRNYFPWTSS